MSDGGIDLERLEHRLGAEFCCRHVDLPPGAAVSYEPCSWRGAIVFVLDGELHVECPAGQGASFRRGDILCVAALPAGVLRNRGAVPARLLAIRRRCDEPTG
jgi:uncharacterized cupin superfamily protein